MIAKQRYLVVVALVLALAACDRDPAAEAYYRTLEGDEDGSTLEERLAHIDYAIELAPDRAAYYELRALLRLSACRTPEAIDDLDRAVGLVDSPYLHFLRGLMYCRISQFERALDDFDTAISGQPENTQFYRGRSLARSATGDGAGALADAEHLVAAGPHGHRLYARGVAYATLGQDALALRDFDAALRARPELLYVISARASSYERLGRLEEAAADHRRMEQVMESYRACDSRLSPFHY